MPLIEYMCHPIAGNVEKNVAEIQSVMKQRHTPECIPFAPYLTALRYLRDDDPEDRELGMRANEEFFRENTIDRVYVFGDRLSNGMRKELVWAYSYNILVDSTPERQSDVENILPFHMSYLGHRQLPKGNFVVVLRDMKEGDIVAFETEDVPHSKNLWSAENRPVECYWDEAFNVDWQRYKHAKDTFVDMVAQGWGLRPLSQIIRNGR